MKNPDYWQESINYLINIDEKLAKVIKKHEKYTISTRVKAFETLLRSIVGQQISVKAAASVWLKLTNLIGIVEPNRVQSESFDNLRSCGLSKQKTQYILNISEHFITNNILNNSYWQDRKYSQIYNELIAIKGIGPWTIEMFGMFYLLEKDIFPIKDVGIIRAMNQLYASKQNKLELDQIIAISDTWRPYRTVACWFLWRSIDSEDVLY